MMNVESENEEGGDDVVAEALKMGWVDKEDFKGNPDKWVPAEEFVEKGKHVLPILLANNKRLQSELLTRDAKIDKLQSTLESSQKAIQALQETQSAATKRAVEAAITRVKSELKSAREDDDLDAELALKDQLDDLKKTQSELSAPAKGVVEDTKAEEKSALSPEFIAWQKDNPWFNGTSSEDKKQTKEVLRMAEDLRDEGSTLVGREFMELCVQEVEKKKSGGSGRPVGKVESGNSGSRRSSSSSKGYADLPADAKAACDGYNDDLVGPDKQYKTVQEWRAVYSKSFFGDE